LVALNEEEKESAAKKDGTFLSVGDEFSHGEKINRSGGNDDDNDNDDGLIFTEHEVEVLTKAVSEYGKDWRKVADLVGRLAVDCQAYYNKNHMYFSAAKDDVEEILNSLRDMTRLDMIATCKSLKVICGGNKTALEKRIREAIFKLHPYTEAEKHVLISGMTTHGYSLMQIHAGIEAMGGNRSIMETDNAIRHLSETDDRMGQLWTLASGSVTAAKPASSSTPSGGRSTPSGGRSSSRPHVPSQAAIEAAYSVKTVPGTPVSRQRIAQKNAAESSDAASGGEGAEKKPRKKVGRPRGLPPGSLPKGNPAQFLNRRVNDEGILEYQVKWKGNVKVRWVSIAKLVSVYGKAVTDMIVQFDALLDVEFALENVVGHIGEGRNRKFLVQWKYYPDAFNTYEPVEMLGDMAGMVRTYDERVIRRGDGFLDNPVSVKAEEGRGEGEELSDLSSEEGALSSDDFEDNGRRKTPSPSKPDTVCPWCEKLYKRRGLLLHAGAAHGKTSEEVKLKMAMMESEAGEEENVDDEEVERANEEEEEEEAKKRKRGLGKRAKEAADGASSSASASTPAPTPAPAAEDRSTGSAKASKRSKMSAPEAPVKRTSALLVGDAKGLQDWAAFVMELEKIVPKAEAAEVERKWNAKKESFGDFFNLPRYNKLDCLKQHRTRMSKQVDKGSMGQAGLSAVFLCLHLHAMCADADLTGEDKEKLVAFVKKLSDTAKAPKFVKQERLKQYVWQRLKLIEKLLG
jgi:hypothetical protein